ncbi:uncharacterized protein LOC125238540 [Leguminivora glycinivorella]|uniref:uncharacterized protein LOC125238540 n=1 Tax=Leguminivora glycinivorella TaxID=1035111 RepID=UPI00200F1853|nr:uncharacterized protein LOC125238540 [Leguminivora glycinivorella]
MEQAEESSEQAACSGEQTGASERAETAAEPMDCSEPGQTKEATCSPDDKETIPSDLTAEPVVLSSGSEDQSTQSETPAQDVEMTETWLNHFVEQLGRVPSLWRPGSHRYSGPIKEKTARGFAYVRLITGLEPDYEGDNKSRIQRALALCRRFFSALKKEHRKAALAALEENPLASPDDALRSCPIWVRRADSFLNQMPLVVAQINAQIQEKSHRGSSQREKSKKKKPAGSSLFLKHLGMAPPRLQVPVPPGEEGIKYVRRVVRGIRRAAKVHGGPNKEAIKEVAQRLGATSNRIYQIWWGLCQLALYKLGQVVARGDAAADSGRLDALDWAIADVVLLYTRDMLHDSQYKNYEQLSALLGTFHLVQRFELEKPKQEASPQEWVTAARWYNRNGRSNSKNRVQMSALALQKRWFELKQDTRKRFLAQMGVYKSGLPPLPLHQAIARR